VVVRFLGTSMTAGVHVDVNVHGVVVAVGVVAVMVLVLVGMAIVAVMVLVLVGMAVIAMVVHVFVGMAVVAVMVLVLVRMPVVTVVVRMFVEMAVTCCVYCRSFRGRMVIRPRDAGQQCAEQKSLETAPAGGVKPTGSVHLY
jgi:hypothetical protein